MQQQVIAKQADRIAELQRRLGQDSSTSSRPPSADAPWDKQPAKKRSSRSRSGHKLGKQPGSPCPVEPGCDLQHRATSAPDQARAQAMADTLEANQAAHQARTAGAEALGQALLDQIRNHYLGALAIGHTGNQHHRRTLATQVHRLTRRFTRYEDTISRFAVDLTVPFTNNCTERAIRKDRCFQRYSE